MNDKVKFTLRKAMRHRAGRSSRGSAGVINTGSHTHTRVVRWRRWHHTRAQRRQHGDVSISHTHAHTCARATSALGLSELVHAAHAHAGAHARAHTRRRSGGTGCLHRGQNNMTSSCMWQVAIACRDRTRAKTPRHIHARRTDCANESADFQGGLFEPPTGPPDFFACFLFGRNRSASHHISSRRSPQ